MALPDPMVLLANDQRRAREAGDPMARLCVLATVSADGRPAARTLVVRSIDAQAITVFLNASSPKWHQLVQTPQFELLLHWPSIEQQYRVAGSYEALAPAEVAKSWVKQPHASKLLDWWYERAAQSSPLDSRAALLEGIGDLEVRYPRSEDVPFPASAIGLRLMVTTIDHLNLDQRSRLHDRRRFCREAQGWTQTFLVP